MLHTRASIISRPKERLATPTGGARHACDALEAAFRQHGAPLVAESDQGSPFTSGDLGRLLEPWEVIALLSPPYTPWYNGAIEAGNVPDADVRAVVARAAERRALETLGYLCVRRKRITPPFNSHLRHNTA